MTTTTKNLQAQPRHVAGTKVKYRGRFPGNLKHTPAANQYLLTIQIPNHPPSAHSLPSSPSAAPTTRHHPESLLSLVSTSPLSSLLYLPSTYPQSCPLRVFYLRLYLPSISISLLSPLPIDSVSLWSYVHR